jgi:AcrR family transcriptional regulator
MPVKRPPRSAHRGATAVGRGDQARPTDIAAPKRAYRSERRAAAVGQTRERIVAAARDLLVGGGDLPAFSLDGVARHAGVTRLTVYNQFVSKQGLLEAVFDDIAQRGGLFTELPVVFAEPDPHIALRRLVTVFCHFWAHHGLPLARVRAATQLDDEIAASLQQRTERRRLALRTLIQRLIPADASCFGDVVDVLFALTSFETYEALAVHGRSARATEELVAALVEQALAHLGARPEPKQPRTRRS